MNPTGTARELVVQLAGGRALSGSGQRWVITGPNRWSANRPGAPRQVDIRGEAVTGDPGLLDAAPLSVSLYSLPLR
jgi:hypothetical protein